MSKKKQLDLNTLADTDESLDALKSKTGFLTKWNVERQASKEAGNALSRLEHERIASQTRLGVQAIKLTEAGLSASLLANAMPVIGALTTQANLSTAAVDQALSNGAQAEYFTHINNRTTNLALTQSQLQDGKINAEESGVLCRMADEAAVQDIQRSHQRMMRSKETVDELYQFTLQGIQAVKGRLS